MDLHYRPLDVKPLSEHSFGSSDVVADPFDRTRRSTLTRARVRDQFQLNLQFSGPQSVKLYFQPISDPFYLGESEHFVSIRSPSLNDVHVPP